MNRASPKPGTAIVYDSPGDFDPEIPPGVYAYPIPMSHTAKEMHNPRAKNMVAMGAMFVRFNIPVESLREVITAKFARKGDDVVKGNLDAFERGRELAKALDKTDPWTLGTPKGKQDVLVMSGHNALGLGALIAGLDFFSAYPITPATEVAIYVAKHLPKRGGTLIQAEDEIASISQVLGASYAGKKAMTCTSGPGLSLMSEMLGMAFMSELPCVVVDAQRGGRSTGLLTKQENTDLFLAIHGGHSH